MMKSRLVREKLGWEHAPFVVPEAVYAAWDARESGAAAEQEWDARFAEIPSRIPGIRGGIYSRRIKGELPADWTKTADEIIAQTAAAGDSIASRKASQNALENFAPHLPELIGGSADLAESNLSKWSKSAPVTAAADGNYIYFGVREFAMAAVVNGLAQHGGFKPYGATFLMFSEYARNALRMAALQRIPAIFVFTHDSIGLGEDGPTHQPIEQLATLRLLPNMAVWRPCDAVETAVAWRAAIESAERPHCLILSRQTLPHQPRSDAQIAAIERGGYVLRDAEKPDAIIIATGSEVSLAMDAAAELSARKKPINVRVVSLPSVDKFESQSADYRESSFAEIGDRAGRRRSRRERVMGEICRRIGRNNRRQYLRRIGARRRSFRALRHHHRARRRRRRIHPITFNKESKKHEYHRRH